MTHTTRRLALLTALLAAVAAPRGAEAALLTLAGSTLTVSVGPVPAIAVPQNVAGLPILVSSGGGSFTEPAGLFTGTAMLPPALFTGVPLINGFTLVVSNHTKQIAQGAPAGVVASYFGIHRAGGGLGGPGRLTGAAIVNILALFNLHVPLFPVGYTDDYTSSSGPGGGGPLVTVFGTGWTTGDVTLTGVSTETPSGALVNTVTFGALGFDNRTAGHRGIVQLVSPFKVVSGVAGNLSGYALQTLTFVPEPGTFVLLGLGAAALAGHGLRRRRAGP
jgi:hypothetical protein